MEIDLQETIIKFRSIVEEHQKYRSNCLNMVAAESITSPLVEAIIGSDFSRRYSSPGLYAGDKFFLQAYEITHELLRRLFRAEYVNIKPVTGNLAVLAVLTGLTKPGDIIIKVGDDHGGYPIRIADWAKVQPVNFPFDHENFNIQLDQAVEQIYKIKPKLVILGAAEILFPHPVRELGKAAHDIGAIVGYDGSHVMGLIAGNQFQDPLREGADILYGSTHKTFPGPQRGMITTNNHELFERISHVLMPPPFLLSCFHLNTAVALGVAAAEMLAFGIEFATQIIRNAQELAQCLMDNEVNIIKTKHGTTRSHQVILDNGGVSSSEGIRIKECLEDCGILADSKVRIGTQEVTRMGMKEAEMRFIASLIADSIHNRRKPEQIKRDVETLINDFKKIVFCFEYD